MKIEEQLANLLPGVEISEEFVKKFSASIETAVAKRVETQTKAIEEKAEKYVAEAKAQIEEITSKANAYAEYVVKEMTKKVDDYCEFVIEKFIEENKRKLVETEEYCRMSKTLRAIKESFEKNYFQLNAEPANKDLLMKLKESKDAFNQLFEEHRSLKHKIDEYGQYVEKQNRKNIFETLTINLADSQKEKIAKLVERANFDNLATYETGVKLLVEELDTKVSKITETKKPTIENHKSETIIEQTDNKMKSYLSRL